MRWGNWIHGLAISCSLLVGMPAWAQDPPLVVGVLPRRNVTDTVNAFAPLVEHLATQLGRRAVLEPAKDFDTFWQAVAAKRYDLVHFNQLHYIRGHRDYGYQVIVKNEEFGDSTITGAIVVHRDSTLDTVAQLKGKKIAFGGNRDAMIGYIVPTALLRRAGLKRGDYSEVFVKNPANAITMTYIGETEASGTGTLPWHASALTGIDMGKVRVIAKSEPLPHLPWAVTREMPAPLRQNIERLLTSLHRSDDGARVLKQAQLTRLVPARDSEYDVFRRLLAELGDEIQ